VTARALAVLGAFDAEHMRLALSEISRRTGLPLTTVHRLIRELESWRARDHAHAPGLVQHPA
jgi:DNA-binding IclR family transcriptional regulator